ncbi:hypothetical protein MNEG_8642 [Monoraphidium neglectum]|uniref:Patatin n=1 Tax=Monoraphidium neglectum TaxID=145388 RepID=A0A0D2JJ36_9CHLO|nr:hypothetical protein MNEG_8642 [Monoraphidium neglectum]KIY99322.1 hypothetical protein MNEG_8642 [Monoraphidium neglectum]|eukprot:XP_013898342.1 hypothetical protein MNEG_8642 [Monoraphidium neglectum]
MAPELLSLAAAAAAAPARRRQREQEQQQQQQLERERRRQASPLPPLPPQQQQPRRPAAAAPELELMQPLPPPDHPVLELLRRRLAEGSVPGRRRDGFKLGLAVEGGGMRGIVTGAMLIGLLGFDARGAFDAVYGASAGAMNASYFLTGQKEGLDIYTDHLATSDSFLSLQRYWMGGDAPAMDLEFLLGEVMGSRTPLDWQAVIDRRARARAAACAVRRAWPRAASGAGPPPAQRGWGL